MESNFKERLADSEFTVPNREKIQCLTCLYAARTPVATKKGDKVADDRIDYDDCQMYDDKPNYVLFPDKQGNYKNCPKYKGVTEGQI